VETYRRNPVRLTGALLALQDFMDRALMVIGEEYLATKQNLVYEVQARNAAILESSLDAIVCMDASGRICEFNQAAEEMFGLPRAEVFGKPLAELLIPERMREVFRGGLDRYLRTGEANVLGKRFEITALRVDGAEFPVEVAIVPTASDAGILFTGFLRDISDRKRHEETRELWAHVFKQSDIGLALVRPRSGALQLCNPAFARIHGYELSELVGRTVSNLFGTPAQDLLRGGVSGAFEREQRRKDGTIFPALVTISVVESLGQSGALRVVSVVDLTERKRAQQARQRSLELEEQNRRIQEASRLKSEFLANMSHELRTPLNSIIGFAEVLHDGEVEPESPEHHEFLGDILRSGRHLLQLINDVLDLSKIEAGKLEFHPESLSIEPLVCEVTTILRATAAAKRIRITVSVHPDVDKLWLDPGRMKQVLYNYLSNALKFTPEGGNVFVRVEPEGAEAFRLEVEDTGIGIVPDDVPRLFVEFQQLDGGLDKKQPGTGLGLALTKRLVEAQGGAVGVRSTPGVGSVFFALLPRHTLEGSPLPEPQVFEGARHGVPRVLVVEDDAADQASIVAALTGAGYAVETTATGAQALQRARDVRFDAITLDLLLPDMSGLDVLAAVRADGASHDARVIVVSVVAEEHTVAGIAVEDILAKPIDEGALLRSLRRLGIHPEERGPVLVVDDDMASLRLMEVTLSQHGYRVVCRSDGASALATADDERPSAVVLDLAMPEMDGFEFLARFRGKREHLTVPVLIWTVKDLSADEYRQLRASAQAVVLKGRDGTSTLVDLLKELAPQGELASKRELTRSGGEARAG
ncbi:MAG TPA: PAS domain S-box protein, partial [Polyangiaceae bacterium]|nr:PAS domain S-box protein [Polyangiaceae bacterium]